MPKKKHTTNPFSALTTLNRRFLRKTNPLKPIQSQEPEHTLQSRPMTQPAKLELVYQSRSGNACRARSVVLSAAGVSHQVHHHAGRFVLLVAPADAARAATELAAYEVENPPPVRRAPHLLRHANGWGGVAGYAAILIAVEWIQRTQQFGHNWFQSGQTSAGLIKGGQWWRTVTALTLHTDLPHLVGNLVIGGLFGLLVGQHLGSGLAWLSILVAGAAGNYLNALIHQPTHTSVGASTAVFGALGILAGSGWHHRRHSPTRSLARWTPLIGGAILLGYLGSGGERTDVGAHVGGFVSGLILGALIAKFGKELGNTRQSQLVFAAIALAILALAWTLALTPP
jgi:membrane associated rhomboid family serine protease